MQIIKDDMKKVIYILSAVLLAITLPSCNEDEIVDSARKVSLKLDITASAGSEVDGSRALGDPGIAEFFEKPTVVHVFMAVGDPKTPQSNPVYWYTVNNMSWQRSADSLYFRSTNANGQLFSQDIQVAPSIKFDALAANRMRAYMVASYSPITFDDISTTSFGKCQKASTKADLTEQQLFDLKIFASGTSGSSDYSVSLRDLYSSPFNLRMEGANFSKLSDPVNVRTGYYGTATAKDVESVTFTMTLYHTAAKIDFQWNAESNTQANVMQYALIANAPKKGYVFKPTETVASVERYSKILLDDMGSEAEAAADDDNTGHSARYADAFQANPSNQWSGRAYTYVLQPGDLSYKIKTASVSALHEGTVTVPVADGNKGNKGTNDIFAAWYKLDFNIGSNN